MSNDLGKLKDENTSLKNQFKSLSEEKKKVDANLVSMINEKTSLLSQIDSLKQNIVNMTNEKQTLQEQLQSTTKERPSIKIDEVGLAVHKSLQSIKDKLADPKGIGDQYFVDKFEVEIKSGLEIKDGLTLVQPSISELTPESLSTIRMSLKSKPKVTVASE